MTIKSRLEKIEKKIDYNEKDWERCFMEKVKNMTDKEIEHEIKRIERLKEEIGEKNEM